MGLVYKVTNIITSDVYIGRTKHSLDYRKSRHLRKALVKKIKNKFYNAIRKYGQDNFKWDIILDNLTWDESKRIETIEIIKYNSFHNGYNSTIGGECGPKPSIAEDKGIEILKLANEGIHINEIGRILKIKKHNIRRYCNKNNIPHVKISGSIEVLSNENKNEIRKLHKKGYHVAKIYKSLNLPRGPVNRFIKSELNKSI